MIISEDNRILKAELNSNLEVFKYSAFVLPFTIPVD